MIERIDIVCPRCGRRERIPRGVLEDYSGGSGPGFMCRGDPAEPHLEAEMVPDEATRYNCPEFGILLYTGAVEL